MPVIERYDSMKMLTSTASQYLPPDYLQPLPTTLDAKNSPLALLAQTCSSIGKDPPSKSIIPPLERKETSGKSPHSDSDPDTKVTPKLEKDGRSSTSSNDQRRGESKDISNFYPISTSSPKPERIQLDNKRPKQERHSNDGDRKSPIPTSKPLSLIQGSGLNGSKPNIDRGSPRPKTSDLTKDNRDSKYSPSPKSRRSESPIRREHSPGQETKHPHSLYPGIPYGPFGLAYPGAMPPTAEAFPAGYPYPGFPSQSNYNLASAHALAAHQAALKSGSSAALSQYMQYARMRNPVSQQACKDPYCTNCLSAAAQGSHLSHCTSPGCAQCSHEKTLLQGMGLFGMPGSNPLQSPFSVPSSASVGLTHLHNLYAQSLLTQQGQQHVCNWMMGNDYCGKRFGTSEELLQHLRTHTSGGEAALSAYSNLGLSIPSPTDLPPGIPGYLGSSGSISPETLRRMYPTSISPLSGSSLSNRYHPYKTSLSNIPSGLPTHQSLSSLGPYYSPYSLYAQRIGAAAVP